MNLPDWICGPTPAGEFALSAWLFLRLLGLAYLSAFVSLAGQIRGLVGSGGILPATNFLAAQRSWGGWRFVWSPSLCWFHRSDRTLLFLCWGGAALALLLIVGCAAWPLLLLLWLFYLSLFTAGQVFLRYQWDLLLLEAGFLAIFLAPAGLSPQFPPTSAPPRLVLWLFWWLLFRVMFFSGVVKWRHGDPSWRRLTALGCHFETQPLPTRLAWWAHQLPAGLLKFATAAMLGIELIVPWLIFAPAPWRHGAAAAFVLLLLVIQLTGNYGFFQLLGLGLCVLLLEDQTILWLASLMGASTALPQPTPASSEFASWLVAGLAFLVVVLSVDRILATVSHRPHWPRALIRFFDFLEPFCLVNRYGLFAVMTGNRPELVFEGTEDGVNWREYEFKWKPGDETSAPRFLSPHMPRLDWQLWFAAQETGAPSSWLGALLARLAAGSPEVRALLRHDPFEGGAPRQVRALLYDYRFTTRTERRAGGAWWQRERRGVVQTFPDSSVATPSQRASRRRAGRFHPGH